MSVSLSLGPYFHARFLRVDLRPLNALAKGTLLSRTCDNEILMFLFSFALNGGFLQFLQCTFLGYEKTSVSLGKQYML